MYNISIELTQEFQKRKVEVKEFITLDENSDTVKYLFQDLELDLDYDILYPEGFSEVLEYDSQNNENRHKAGRRHHHPLQHTARV